MNIANNLEVPTGFGPMLIELQSIALPAWLRNHCSVLYYITRKLLLSIENQTKMKEPLISIKGSFLDHLLKIIFNSIVTEFFVKGFGDE